MNIEREIKIIDPRLEYLETLKSGDSVIAKVLHPDHGECVLRYTDTDNFEQAYFVKCELDALERLQYGDSFLAERVPRLHGSYTNRRTGILKSFMQGIPGMGYDLDELSTLVDAIHREGIAGLELFPNHILGGEKTALFDFDATTTDLEEFKKWKKMDVYDIERLGIKYG